MENEKLIDPTKAFCEAVCEDARVCGDKIANKHFEGDMAIAMGEVFGDMLACGVMNAVGSRLFDRPMQM